MRVDGPSKVPPRSVFVVDDVPEILDLFCAMLRRIRAVDAHVEVESNSERAAQTLAQRPFDLVISDFRMRQVDGIEVLRNARVRNPAGLRILTTGYNEVPTTMERIRAASVDAYLQKPLRSQEVILLLNDFLVGNEQAILQAREEARAIEGASQAGAVV